MLRKALFGPYLPYVLLGLAALVLAAVLLVGAAMKDGSVFGPTVANWVEAIGSIAAVTAAAMIAGHQSRQLRVREKLRVRQIRETCAHLAAEAVQLCRERAWTEEFGLQLAELASVLQALAATALEIGDRALQLIRLERALRAYALALRAKRECVGMDSRDIEVRRAARRVRAAAQVLMENGHEGLEVGSGRREARGAYDDLKDATDFAESPDRVTDISALRRQASATRIVGGG